MNRITKSIRLFLLLLLLIECSYAQDDIIRQPSDAVMVQVNKDMRIEGPLRQVAITLSNNSNQLNVKLNIPYYLIRYTPTDNNRLSIPGLPFDLRMMIDPQQVQDYLTSDRVFTTHAILTLNNISKPVKVEYIPVPAGADQDGDFNVSMIIWFNGYDFNLDTPRFNAQFFIRICNLTVNRL